MSNGNKDIEIKSEAGEAEKNSAAAEKAGKPEETAKTGNSKKTADKKPGSKEAETEKQKPEDGDSALKPEKKNIAAEKEASEVDKEPPEAEPAGEAKSELEPDDDEDEKPSFHISKEQGSARSSAKPAPPKARKEGFFRKYRKKLTPFFIILIILLLGYIILVQKKTADAIANAPKPEFREVERRDISNSIAVTATVEADDKRTVSTLVSNTKVLAVNYEVGDYVQEGDVICTFDTTYVSENMTRLQKKMNVTSEKSRVTINDAQIDANKKGTTMAYDAQDNITSEQRKHWNYDTALEDYYNACDGYNDAKDEKEKKEKEYESAKSHYKEWKEKYDNLDLTDEQRAGAKPISAEEQVIKDTYTYYSGLYNTAKTAYETARSKVDTYESDIRTKGIALENARQGIEDAEKKTPRDYLSDGVEVDLYKEKQYVASLDASIANDENEQSMAEYRKQLQNSVVTAPISGMITTMNVHKGDEFADRSKTDVCVIQDDSGYTVKGNVDQYNISKVRVGMKALIRTQATGDDLLEGIVSFVSPVPSGSSNQNSDSGTAKATNVSYPVEIQLAKKDPRLRLGMTAETSLIENKRDHVLVVPYDCVTEDEYGYKCVYVETRPDKGSKDKKEKKTFSERLKDLFIVPDITAEDNTRKVTILTGLETDYYVEIMSDEIKEGDRVKVPEKSDDDSENTDTGVTETSDAPAMEAVDDEDRQAPGNPPPPGGPAAGGPSDGDEALSAGAGEI